MSKSGFSCICNPLPLSSFWCFFFMLLCFSLLSVWMCVIIMSWSQAIWVGWLVCISGVNCYTYSWPGSKLAWIFILSSGCRRVEWVWFQSAEKKLTQPFVWWTRTLDDCHGPVGMPGERRVYAGYCIYLSHVAAIGKQCLWYRRSWKQKQNNLMLWHKHLKRHILPMKGYGSCWAELKQSPPPFIQFWVAGTLEPVPAVMEWEEGYTPNRSPLFRRVDAYRQTTSHAGIHT